MCATFGCLEADDEDCESAVPRCKESNEPGLLAAIEVFRGGSSSRLFVWRCEVDWPLCILGAENVAADIVQKEV